METDLRKKLGMCYSWSIAFYGVENWTLWKVDHTYLKSFEMWYWRRMETIGWTENVKNVKNEKVSRRVKEERNIRHTIKRKNIRHTIKSRNIRHTIKRRNIRSKETLLHV
jgi:hypothetical protein